MKTFLFTSLVAATLLSGCLTVGRGGAKITDPDGRFTFVASHELRPEATAGRFFHYAVDEPEMDAWIVAAPAENPQGAVAALFQMVGVPETSLSSDGIASFKEWRLERFAPDSEGRWLAVASQFRDATAYGLIVAGGEGSDPDSLPTSIMGLLSSFTFTADAGEVFAPATFGELEEFVTASVAGSHGSASIAVLRNDEVIYRFAAGVRDFGVETDPDTAYHWGSITKLVTATAVVQLVENELLSLDDTIDRWFPEFVPASRITVEHLLTHSSGLPDTGVTALIGFDGRELPDMERVLTAYWEQVDHLVFEPGAASLYNNYNFLILGVLVERITGEALTDYTRSHILEPLGMTRTVYFSRDLDPSVPEARAVVAPQYFPSLELELADEGLSAGDMVAHRTRETIFLVPFDILPCWGGLKGPASDALLLGQLFVGNGTVNGNAVLSRVSVRDMLRGRTATSGRPLGFGLGWHVGMSGREPYAEHSGGGAGIESLLRIYPRSDTAVAVFGNANEYGAGTIEEYVTALVRENRR